jgi:aminopeptidase N
VDEEHTDAEGFRLVRSVVMHELAHQWFGNLVTMGFLDGRGLNGSFADWAELYAWELLDLEPKMWQEYVTKQYQNVFAFGSKRSRHRIKVPVM